MMKDARYTRSGITRSTNTAAFFCYSRTDEKFYWFGTRSRSGRQCSIEEKAIWNLGSEYSLTSNRIEQSRI